MSDLTGSTVLVTGANRGIGEAMAQAFNARGSRVLGGVRQLDDEHAVPAGAQRVQVDLSTPEALHETAGALLAAEPNVDVLVNNAGRWTGGLFDEEEIERIREVLWVNLGATIELTRLVLPGMIARGNGKIVLNASIVGRAPFPGAAAYAAAKAGLTAFGESLRSELDGTGVSVLELVTPGVDTEMMDQVQRDLDGHVDTSGWDHNDPEDWAAKVADAIESDDDRLDPGGAERLAELLPAKLLGLASRRTFDR